jgi:hypothetical protein
MPSMHDMVLFVGTLISNWAAFMTGGIPAALFLLIERWRTKQFEWKTFALIFFGLGFFAASYQTWKHEYVLRKNTEQTGNPSGSWQLTAEQRAKLSSGLRLAAGEEYSIEINSVPSCETCEEFAQELRELIGNIPGWKAPGSTLVFSIPFRRGLKLVTKTNERNLPFVVRLVTAFESAGIPLPSEEEENLIAGTAIIVVGRRTR